MYENSIISIFSINDHTKNFVLNFCVSSETLTKGFCHEETQNVAGSYHADKLQLVIFAMYVNFNIFTWKYISKKVTF